MPQRFNVPPGWPTPPPGFVPGPGWQPDPAWPPAPPGWQFWVDDGGDDTVLADAPWALLAPQRLRLQAAVVDLLVVLVPLGVLLLTGRLATLVGLDLPLLGWVSVVLVSLAAVLGLSVWLTGGQTPGKAMFAMTERHADGRPLQQSTSALAWSLGRHSFGYVVIDVLGIGVLAALLTRRRQCLHDLVFRSEVVYLPAVLGGQESWEERGRRFSARLEEGLARSRERYGWISFLWRWVGRVILAVAAGVFAVVGLVKAASAAAASTPAQGPATALSGKGTAAVVVSTSLATGGILAAAQPVDDAYTNINVVVSRQTVGQDHTAEVHRMKADGSELEQLTDNEVADGGPDLFRDEVIVFSRLGEAGVYDLWTMAADGTDQRLLARSDGNDGAPDWSPDGERIAFTSDRSGQRGIWVIDADGAGARQLTSDEGSDSTPDWSHDGDRIAYTSNRAGTQDIWVMDADGGRSRRLTEADGASFEPRWSPDGNRIVFTSDRDGNNEIYVMDADGSSVTRLTNDPADDSDAFWAPDGDKILFNSRRGLEGGGSEIWAVNPDGTELDQLTDFNSPS